MRKHPSAAARAAAAAWAARLHGPNRTPEVEAGVRKWLAENAQHRAAFELITDTWEKSGRLRRRPFEKIASWERPGLRMSFSRVAIAAAAVVVLSVLGARLHVQDGAYTTGVGEQRTIVLEDGSRIYLNTDTIARVHYDQDARRVDLKKGEALFEVAKQPDWPFLVSAGGHHVRALGTSFVVRRDARQVTVTLIEGKVNVSSEAHTPPLPASSERGTSRRARHETPADGTAIAQNAAPAANSRWNGNGGSPDIITLAPGQRLIFAKAAAPQIDEPQIDQVTAWQRGEISLDNTPLADAVVEMNRYSRTRLVIEEPLSASIRISGRFRAGDAENFALAVGRSYGLEVRLEPERITLAGIPH